MQKRINSMVEYCVHQGYISVEQSNLLQYAIEKRLVKISIAIPFLIVGICISSAMMACAFLLSFYYIREYTNGMHASDIRTCFITSLMTELLFLGVLPRVADEKVIISLAMSTLPVIYYLAPYRCPQMNYTDKELEACANKAKQRTMIVIITFSMLEILDFGQIALGLELGLVMAGFLLVIAYKKRSVIYERSKQKK